jgi:hypothetical protein
MRVGINGMGRIGRLAPRAAMGGMYRANKAAEVDQRMVRQDASDQPDGGTAPDTGLNCFYLRRN